MLGGYCLGGTLALEMARQLIESGEPVGLLALIEIYNIRFMSWPLPAHLRFINRFILNPYFHLQNLLAAEGAGKLAFFNEKFQVELSRMKVSVRRGAARLRHRFRALSTDNAPQPKLADLYEQALTRYDVKPYPGEIMLFLAQSHLAGYPNHQGGWGEVAQSGVRCFSLPISPRGSLVEPYVGELAGLLRTCLDRATQNSKPVPLEAAPELVGTH
jgi:thioesterase domain-containing protein